MPIVMPVYGTIDRADYGTSLHADIYGCDRSRISDRGLIRQWVADLIDLLGMKAFGETEIESFGHNDPVTSGLSARQWIHTSSIEAHFSPHLRSLHADIFSCRPFDAAAALSFTAERFGAAENGARGVVLSR